MEDCYTEQAATITAELRYGLVLSLNKLFCVLVTYALSPMHLSPGHFSLVS